MAENLLSKFNLDGTEMIIADTKARSDASDAVSKANTAISTANKADTNANTAKELALKAPLITYDGTTHTMKITQGGV